MAEECNHAEIIEALKGRISEVEMLPSETDRLASHKPQPVAANPKVFQSNSYEVATGKEAASTVLPPFAGTLNVDKKLKLCHDDFKQ